jgi:uncharacterized protein (DUF983 family)
MLKGTRIYSIAFNKCPRCHQGSFFKTNHPYHLRTFADMHNQCELCGESFLRETGYYYGAMYVSYALNVLIGLGLFLFMVVMLNLDILVFLFTFVGLELLLFPWTFRTSRLIWINIFVSYKKEAAEKKPNN